MKKNKVKRLSSEQMITDLIYQLNHKANKIDK